MRGGGGGLYRGQGPGRGGIHGRGPGRGPGMAMSMPVERARDFKGALKRLARYLQPHRCRLLIVLVASVLSTAFSIVSPKVMGLATTSLFNSIRAGRGVDFDYISRILLLLGGLYLLSAFFGYIQQFIMAGVAQKTVYALRETVNRKLPRLPLRYFDTHAHGDTLSRVTNDVDLISTTLQQSLTQLISAAVSLSGILVMMLIISPLLTLIALLIIPLSFIVTRFIVTRSQKYFARQQQELGALNGHVEEMFSGHVLVKAFGREAESIRRFDGINIRLYDAGWKAQFITGIIMPLMIFINNLGYVLVCVFGSLQVARGALPIGDIQAFIHYSKHFTQPITQTAGIINILQATVASAERVFDLLDEKEKPPEQATAAVIHSPRGEVRFKGVQFGYAAGAPLFKNMNITAAAGQTIAIVGPTGGGKTTLVNLLMRFYDVEKGTITIDGVDINTMRRGNLRSIFGMVLQDTWLFNGTIRDNIAYGRPNASMQEVICAARAAHADHFIRTLPDGYDTLLNEEASNLSQGQKQLLTIARAVLADPAVLILDEATSSVDSRTEQLIQKAMARLMKGRTSFVIAHRLSTIRNADLILVMHEGKIIETGTHRELLDRHGFYASLYQSQFTAIAAEPSP